MNYVLLCERERERVDGVLGGGVLVVVAEGGGVILIGCFVSGPS